MSEKVDKVLHHQSWKYWNNALCLIQRTDEKSVLNYCVKSWQDYEHYDYCQLLASVIKRFAFKSP